jgi:hypothetical protein
MEDRTSERRPDRRGTTAELVDISWVARRLTAAMRELNARLRVAGVTDEDASMLPIGVDADTLGRMELSTWRTDAGDFDILTDLPELSQASSLRDFYPPMLEIAQRTWSLRQRVRGHSGERTIARAWEWPALQLWHGGLVTQQVVVDAVALLRVLLRAADEGLLGVGAVAEDEVEEVVIGPTDDVGAHERVPSPGRRILDVHGGGTASTRVMIGPPPQITAGDSPSASRSWAMTAWFPQRREVSCRSDRSRRRPPAVVG